jgi:toxin-antitoxin system PIN domain toxin
VIVPDANLLIYAYDTTSPSHLAARRWWEGVLSGREPVGLPWIVVLAFVRLITHPTLSEHPFTVRQAEAAVRQWLDCDHVQLLVPRETTFARFFSLLDEAGLGGNLATDALIAAHAEDYGGTVYSTDRDFDRFEGGRWLNPLEDKPAN